MQEHPFPIRLLLAVLVAVASRCSMQAQSGPAHEAVIPRLDTAAVLRIAGMRITEELGELEFPNARLREDGVWEASQLRIGHTRAGRCKRTNGCTVVRTRRVLIDDRTGRVLDRARIKRVFPNYE